MRRLCSISAIAALALQLVSPLLAAAACPHATHMPACHRAAQQAQAAQHHHCDAVMPEQQTEPVAPDSEAAFKTADSPANCPMDCCGASVVTNAAAVAAGTPLPSLVATDQNFNFVPVTFTTAGFSSHTDRGPPAA